MDKVMIINGSPRAPKSNSKRYAEIFMQKIKLETSYFTITKTNHSELCEKMNSFSHLLLVFPLYADGIPVSLLNFFKTLEKSQLQHRPTISIVINCGFIECAQNDVAIEMVKLFCKANHYPFGSVLSIGGGEAILNTPFKIFVSRALKKLAISISNQNYKMYQVTMPLTKKLYIKASTQYWINYGKGNGITEEAMRTMKIEE